ncbi:hypothetical protein [Homoserinibacter sp. YIM 151385]|uniref:hypothetical protein n=1 Tax=Homoserinibacter sp. YIM 151385 TaxID=2985506 RepID=UPI0022F0E410|nr:hypothetical protein [Homoserinibacter sp. YIM 151385]WBU36893.1 hypothetical protein OF852_08090 [Homoserinibacter sp. YIM 151385]
MADTTAPLRHRVADRLVGSFRANASWILLSAGAASLTAAGIADSDWLPAVVGPEPALRLAEARPALTITGVIFGLVGFALRFVVRPTYAEAVRRMERAEAVSAQTSSALESALHSLLVRLARHCELDSSHQRVSIYLQHGEEFVILARYSSNPELAKVKRTTYPSVQGVIGRAWQGREEFVRRLPESPDEGIRHQVEHYGFTEEEARAVSTRSRSICGFRIDHADRSLGVLVMESLNKQGVSQRSLDAAKNSLLLESAGKILYASSPSFPAIADRAG